MERPEVECITCTKSLPRQSREEYRPLEHFENHCICNECLRLYRESAKPGPAATGQAAAG